MKATKARIEDTYKKLTAIEHCLHRPDTYIGSILKQPTLIWIPESLENFQCSKKEIEFAPGLLKIFDEILTNASDHVMRTGQVKFIKIDVGDNWVSVENDGPGIPVEKHKEENMWLPQLLFFNLYSGSNFNDEEARLGAGRNGMGACLTSIFSDKLIVETADGKKSYVQEATDHIRKIEEPIIKKSKLNFTKITFYPDLKYFGYEDQKFDQDILRLFLKRVIDVAAYCPKVKITWNGQLIPIKSFKDWMSLHLESDQDLIYDSLDENWDFGVAKTPDSGFEQISIVNGISTHRGGTHVNRIAGDLSKAIYEILHKKHKKIKFKWEDVKNNLFLFLICKIPNPTFDTQTKENLTNNITKEILSTSEFNSNIIKKIIKSDICQSILDWLEAKELQNLKKLNKQLKQIKVQKLVDAKSKKREDCILYIFEGLSAMSAFRKFRNPQTMGAFPLRGKFINVSELSPSKILQNEEAKDLMASMGLAIGKKAELEDLRFGKIYIAADQDPDGFSISALLINFFHKFWPEIFDYGIVAKVNTPLSIAKNGKKYQYLYTNQEIHDFFSSMNGTAKDWKFEYKKGLASLEDREYELMFKNPNLHFFNRDEIADATLNIWFGNSSELRKEKLLV